MWNMPTQKELSKLRWKGEEEEEKTFLPLPPPPAAGAGRTQGASAIVWLVFSFANPPLYLLDGNAPQESVNANTFFFSLSLGGCRKIEFFPACLFPPMANK